MPEPQVKRAAAFFDGQNLFHSARVAFGHSYPNYDPRALASTVCTAQGWELSETHFYTGVPSPLKSPRVAQFWDEKLAWIGRTGVQTLSRPLRYQGNVAREKGIDVRIALDVIALALDERFDVALVFSQDNDLAEVAVELRRIARLQQRWIKVASAFPVGPTSRNPRGIQRTDWLRIDQATYDSCLDLRDYGPKWRPAPSP